MKCTCGREVNESEKCKRCGKLADATISELMEDIKEHFCEIQHDMQELEDKVYDAVRHETRKE